MNHPRFAVDAMLGRLARWLRVLGFDTRYDITMSDPLLVQLASDEQRILLTRDRHLLRELRPVRAYEVRHDAPLEQLSDLVRALQLPPPDNLFTRCMLCNTLLAELDHEASAQLLPPGAQGPARLCVSCGRVYWEGSHVRRMRAALETALPGWLQP